MASGELSADAWSSRLLLVEEAARRAERGDLGAAEEVALARATLELSSRLMALHAVAIRAHFLRYVADGYPETDADRWACAETATACGVSEYTMGITLDTANALVQKIPQVGTALRDGRLDWSKARTFAQAIAGLSGEEAAAITDLVLPRAGKLTTSQLRTALDEARLLVTGADAETRARKAREERGVVFRQLSDSMAEMVALLPAEEAAMLQNALRRLADAAASPDDPRTADQRRADTLVDTIIDATRTTVTPTHPEADIPDEAAACGEARGADPRSDNQPDEAAASSEAEQAAHSGEARGADPEADDQADEAAASRQADDAAASRQADDAAAMTERQVTPDPTIVSGKAAPGIESGIGLRRGMDTPRKASLDLTDLGTASPSESPQGLPPTSPPTGLGATGGGKPSEPDRSESRGSPGGRSGRSWPLHALVTVSLTTLLGLDDDPATLAGHGPLPAGIVRELLTRATWQCAVVDDEHGTLLGLGRSTFTPNYTPGKPLSDHVIKRDQTCRFRGCRRPAASCELDHLVPHPRGKTCSCNLGPACVHHHRLKHEAGWSVAISTDPDEPPGSLEWTSPTGHRHIWRAPALTPSHTYAQLTVRAAKTDAKDRAISAFHAEPVPPPF